MKISHLRTYLKVASTGSFTRAAQELFMTQPTVTHHIQSLEQELGHQLFIRSTSNIRLTSEGKYLVQKSNEIFRIIDEIKGSSTGQDKGICGALNIAASSVMGDYYLPEILKIIIEQYPNIEIKLHFGTAYTIATWVQNGFVDIGLAPLSPGFSRLNFTPLVVEPCVLAISTSRYDLYRKELENGNFTNQPFILREKGTKIHDLAMKWLKKQSCYSDLRTPIILSNMESIKNLVLTDAGVTIIPRRCVMQQIQNGTMIDAKSYIPIEDINYFQIERKNENQSEAIILFKRLLNDNTIQAKLSKQLRTKV